MESSLKLESMPTFCRSAILQAETNVMNKGRHNYSGTIISYSPRGIRIWGINNKNQPLGSLSN